MADTLLLLGLGSITFFVLFVWGIVKLDDWLHRDKEK